MDAVVDRFPEDAPPAPKPKDLGEERSALLNGLRRLELAEMRCAEREGELRGGTEDLNAIRRAAELVDELSPFDREGGDGP